MKRRLALIPRAVWQFLHPFRPGGLEGPAAVLLYAVCTLSAIHISGADSRLEGTIGPMMFPPYTPDASTFYLPDVRYVVHSPSEWDSGVLGDYAVDDIDYLVTPWGHDAARLPGGPWITYHYVSWGTIYGSGTYLVFTGPNGSRFAYFHLTYTTFSVTMHGGDVVGQTGWPTDPLYSGGGPGGGGDAHLCVAVNAAGRSFLEHLPAKPKLKPLFSREQRRVWNEYRTEHHKRTISYKRDHHLRWFARLWKNANWRKAGGVTREEEWLPQQRVMKEFTQRYEAYWWPAHRRYGVKWVDRRRWIR